jgi:AcrR family transcriptional regulator
VTGDNVDTGEPDQVQPPAHAAAHAPADDRHLAPPEQLNSRAQSKALTRERVLSAAGQVFAEHGYGGASVTEIAAAAKVAVGSIYVHFPNKRALFWAVARQGLLAEQRAAYAIVDTDPRAVVARYDAQIQDCGADPQSVALQAEVWLYSIRDESFRAEMAQHQREIRSMVAELVHQLRARFARDAAPDTATNWLLSDDQVATIGIALGQSLSQANFVDPGSVPDQLFSTTMRQLSGLTQTNPD